MSRATMRQIEMDAAVDQLVELMTAEGSLGATFLIGAGLSVAAEIPLAREIVRVAHQRFAAFCGGIDRLDRNAYGQTMQRLGPQQRRALLEPYFQKAKVNWGHIALAHLIKTGRVPRVLSVNFDQVLARACGLLGLYPAIYDFGAAPVANVKALAEPAIIHLHGQSFGFVQLNTQAETSDHAAKLAPVVRECVQGRPLVIVGYSGQSDGVLDALAACYDDNTNLYWVDLADTPPPEVAACFAGKAYASFVPKADADRFLLKLAQRLARATGAGNWTPAVFHDPLGHLLEEMAPVAEFPAGRGDQKDDVLAFWRTDVTRLREEQKDAFRLTREADALSIQGDTAGAVEKAGEATAAGAPEAVSQRARYWQLIDEGNEFAKSADESSGDTAREAYGHAAEKFAAAAEVDATPHEALYNWGNALAAMARLAEGAEQTRLFGAACERYERAVAIKPDKHEALNNWGITLAAMARLAEGAEQTRLFGAACERYERAVAIKPDKHEALNNWGSTLDDMARLAEGAEQTRLFGAACERYERAVAIKPDYHEALYNWGITLAAMAQLAEGAEQTRLFGAACERYERAVAIKPDKHEALNNWGITLAAMARLAEGAEQTRLFGAACERYERAVAIKPDKHEALNNWGSTLDDMARLAEGAEQTRLFGAACERYERAVAIKPDKHEALNNWGSTLDDMARLAEGAEQTRLFGAACERYERAVAIKPDKHEALNNWGITLAAMARLAEGAEQTRLFGAACERYERAVAIKSDYHEALYNWGITLAAMGRLAEGAEQTRLFGAACERYERAVAIKPDKHEALNNWGSTLLTMAQRAEPSQRFALYEQATEKLMAAEQLKPGAACYNLACVMVLSGLPDATRDYLHAAHGYGMLPKRAHLEADTDLDAVRHLPWFAEILALADGGASAAAPKAAE